MFYLHAGYSFSFGRIDPEGVAVKIEIKGTRNCKKEGILQVILLGNKKISKSVFITMFINLSCLYPFFFFFYYKSYYSINSCVKEMIQTYREKLLQDISLLTDEQIMKIYPVFQIVKKEFLSENNDNWKTDFQNVSVWTDEDIKKIPKGFIDWKIPEF